MSKRRKGRNINGLLLLDKAQGLTSNQALQRVKKLWQAAKAGHTGSLDPLATGMLPICFGEATKFCQYLLESDKHYQVVARLGVKTTTGDSEGDVVAQRSTDKITTKQIEQALVEFRGTITQIPSMFSAIKYQGKPLYELARAGIEVERQARTVHIRELEMIHFEADELHLQVHCSKGTYVRNLVEDLGETLGCGAHVIALRRTGVALFHETAMVTYDNLLKLQHNQGDDAINQHLLTLEQAFADWPQVTVSETLAFYLRRGESVWIPQAPTQGLVSLMLNDQVFIGMGEILSDGKIKPKRLLAQKQPAAKPIKSIA